MIAKMMQGALGLLLGVSQLLTGISCWGDEAGTQSMHQFIEQRQEVDLNSWYSCYSNAGQCRVSMPEAPEHLRQAMPFSETGHSLHYDVYICSFETQAVYMMLVAQYPPAISEESLESFLQGLLRQNKDSRLVFADLVQVQGCQGLDFFIETRGIFFKGRAIIAERTLYLLAMECDKQQYQESHYDYFIDSFKMS